MNAEQVKKVVDSIGKPGVTPASLNPTAVSSIQNINAARQYIATQEATIVGQQNYLATLPYVDGDVTSAYLPPVKK